MHKGYYKEILEYPYYEINRNGLIRRKLRHGTKPAWTFCSPCIANGKARYTLRDTDWLIHRVSVAKLVYEHWGLKIQPDRDWVERVRECIREANNKVLGKGAGWKPYKKPVQYNRTCCDCKAPTNNFRCKACWKKLRAMVDNDWMDVDPDSEYKLIL